MSFAARVTDMHVCPMVTPAPTPVPHVGGPILPAGCPTVLIGGLPAARVTDMCTCAGPPDMIIKGSPTVLIGNMPAARMGDTTAHGGTIMLGHPTTMIGDAGSGGGGGGGAGGAAPGGGGGAGSALARNGRASPSQPPPGQTGPLESEEEEQQRTWIGIRLEDADGSPVANEDFQITLEGGQTLTGTTDEEGYASFEDIDPDQGEVDFSQIPDEGEETQTSEDDATETQSAAEAPATTQSAAEGGGTQAPAETQTETQSAADGEGTQAPAETQTETQSAADGEGTQAPAETRSSAGHGETQSEQAEEGETRQSSQTPYRQAPLDPQSGAQR